MHSEGAGGGPETSREAGKSRDADAHAVLEGSWGVCLELRGELWSEDTDLGDTNIQPCLVTSDMEVWDEERSEGGCMPVFTVAMVWILFTSL